MSRKQNFTSNDRWQILPPIDYILYIIEIVPERLML